MQTLLPLTSAQSSIFHHQCHNEGNPFYNVGGYIRLENPDVDRLTRAHARLVGSFEAFRLRIVVGEAGVHQTHAASCTVELPLVDLSAQDDPQGAAADWLEELFTTCIPLEDAPLYRAALLKLTEHLYFYVGMGHHIALDGIGFVNWGAALARFYGAPSEGSLDLPLEVPNAALVERDQAYRSSDRYVKDRRFWTQKTRGFNDSLFPALQGDVPAQTRRRSAREVLPISPALQATLSTLGAKLQVERHQLVLAVLAVYFSQSYCSDSVVIGIPLHGRHDEGERAKIGLLTQMLPMLVEVDPTASVAGVVGAIRRGQRELLRHRNFPIMEVANDPGNPRPKDQPFDFAFSYLPVGDDPLFDGKPGQLVYCSHHHEQMPLLVTYWDAQDAAGSALFFDYNLGHFPAAEIGAVLRRFVHLLDQLVAQADCPVAELDCVTAEERRHLLAVALGDGIDSIEFDVADRLARQFAERPQHVALEGAFGRVSYAALDRRVAAVAGALHHQYAITKGDRVAVLLPHSPELVVALLALVRLGAVYVPIDPQSPALRTRHILADSQVRLVVTHAEFAREPEDCATDLSWVDVGHLASAATGELPLPSARVQPDDPFYILYTSGSTGVPKGVLINRGAAENLLGGFARQLKLGDGGRWLFLSSVAFDISVVEWLGCLALGNTCVLPSAAQLADPFDLAVMTNAADASFVQTTPSRLKQLYNAGWKPRAGQCVVSAGEPLPTELAENLLACGVVLWNGYGPTEATVYSLVKQVRSDEPAQVRTAIGAQLPGYRHYVLNTHQRLVPPGLPGELVIAGAGLAVGYVNRDDLTERQFVTSGAVPETRLYRTGDVVRHLGGGCFQYLGRNDDQIKLRGYRIELGEIQAAIRQLPGVRDAAVVYRKADGDRPAQLIAYVCADAGSSAAPAGEHALAWVRRSLSEALPGYMVPTAFVAIDALPVSTNGKLDKSRLPQVDDSDADAPTPLQTPQEHRVASVWSEMLGVPFAGLGGHSDFFVLGGDSVLAVRMVARLRNTTMRKVEVGDLFRHSRLSALAARLDALPPWHAPGQIPSVVRDAPDYPVSVVQRQLWHLQSQEPASSRYNMAVAYRVDGPMVPARIEQALAALLERHESLRTVYRQTDAGLRQVVLAAPAWRLETIDGTVWTPRERAGNVEAASLRHAQAPFDLAVDVPFRAQVIVLSDTESVLLLNLHHIAVDGWSIRVLVDQFLDIYTAMASGQSVTLAAPHRQYVDFAAWQHAALAQGAWDGQLTYWEGVLSDAPPQHALPLDGPRSAPSDHAAQPVELAIGPALVTRLRNLAQRLAVTEFSLLQSVFALLACKWSYSDEVVIGSPVLGRGSTELESTVGMFVNVLAYVHRFRSDQRFADYLTHFQRTAAQALENQDIPFERVVEAIRPQRDPGVHPVFQLLFAFQDDLPERMTAGGLRFERLPEPAVATKFDLELLVCRSDDRWLCRWISAPGLFQRESVAALASAYVDLLERVADAPGKHVGEIGLRPALAPAGEWAPVSDVAGVHQLVERRTALCADAVAVRHGDQMMTYGQLNQRANRLARLLLARNVAPGSRVALCLPRSIDLIVATIAVLKAGCAYVPVDPGYPAARQSYILSDADPVCVLSTVRLASECAPVFAGRAQLVLDDPALDVTLAGLAPDDIAPAQVGVSPDSDAYVIYTSGSTGQPKGVLIAHRGLINLAVVQARAFGIDDSSRVLQFASFSFDAATSEWSTALATGAELILVPEDVVPDAAALTRWASAHRVTHATLPPVVLKRLQPAAWPTLTHVISAGEAVSLEEARRWSAHCRFINAYGPSESTVCATIGGINETYGKLTIGQAMEGLVVHVVDKGLRPVPHGAVGELCISGIALAKGYLNKPDQTRAAFVDLPLDNGAVLPIYRTGDRVRLLADGDLIFEGRIDEQVKIRGHRVECAEVEKCIAAHPAIKEVSVFVRKMAADDAVLAAYIAPHATGANATLVEDLRRQLDAQLPSYMVPTVIVALESLPLNRNGKIDKKQLASLEVGPTSRTVRRSLTETEAAVRDIWTSFLGAGVDDPDLGFFESGGYSLLISDVLGAVEAQFGVRPTYREFFDHATVAGLAAFIDAKRQMPSAPAEAHPRWTGQTGVLSFEQQRIWFIDQMEQGSSHYNMPVALELKGAIAPHLIETALRRIVARHESLRTVFAVDAADHPVQIVNADGQLTLSVLPLGDENRDAAVQRLRRLEQNTVFDLRRDLLLRASLLRVSPDEAVLFLTVHHIAADGWSVDRLIAEFGELYAGLLEGQERLLPPLPLQYKDYAAQQRRMAEAGALAEGITYWRQYLDGAPQCHSLPLDYPRGDVPSLRGASWTTRLSGDLAGRLKALSRTHDTTLFVTLQTAFALLIARWSENRDVLVGTPVANRHRADTAPLIGFFVNTLVLRTDCRDNLRFGDLLRRGRNAFLGAFEHQHVPFDVLVDALTQARNPAHAPLVQILFSLQDDPARKLSRLNLPALAFRVLDEDGERPVKFDLELMVSESDDGLVCQWQFDTALFTAGTIRRLFDSFVCLLEAVVEDVDVRILEIDIVGNAERAELLAPPRRLPAAVTAGGLVGERFERVAQQRGDTLAVVHGAQQLSYAQLESRSNRLANWLITSGYAGDRPVAIYMKRGIDLVVAIMAVMKSGSPYLPIDLGYPAQRVGYILQDSRAALLLGDRESVAQLDGGPGQLAICCMDDDGFAREFQCCSDDPAVLHGIRRLNGKGLAYVVYTSGSTGQPKGVVVRQESFLNLVLWYQHDYGFASEDRCLLIGSIGFDMTQKNLFAPLLAGGTLVIPDEYFDPVAISALIAEQQVTVVNCAPSAAYQLVESPERWPALSSLRLLALGGEAIRLNQLRAWLGSPACRARLLNMYGPSECTDIALAADYDKTEAASHAVTVPIGRPIYNCSAYVLNEQMKLQPRGVVGELYIGGVGVSNGYINLDDLNARSFLDGVLEGAGRLYRTGDLVKIDANGIFHYIARADHQVKIRGYRVETAEIDAIIAENACVQQAVTVVREDANGEKSLVAFIVLKAGEAAAANDAVFLQLRQTLLGRLPGFMIPAKFVLLDAMPLTPNGKIDKRALQDAAASHAGWRFARQMRAPNTDTESQLLGIWRELLGHDDIGIDDDFFELGGHSLLVTRLTSKVVKTFALDAASLSVKEFFQHPTIEATARLIDAKSRYSRLLAKEKLLLESGAGIEEGSF
ncbi:non-ribosomal peptide synthetase [Tahibacter amnicola]|uniref:Amino acid adenylation domain-containing protein n=1 Tax=Tahibacter amnicola TaxID=2976241 RepID=A0ABY6B817_9GAMM|nr:non-ribosomal peptide synthetase [Tahibacter amnicola]UXI66228.1 amino acid adenylation domain-containing protein [Tahibacter amnicola]